MIITMHCARTELTVACSTKQNTRSLFELHVVLDLVWVLFVSLCFTRTISKFYDALADQAQASSNLISVRSVEIWHYLVQGGVTQVHLDTDIVS
jgi:hypothetical protein